MIQMPWRTTPMQRPSVPVAVLDVETTGFGATDRIVEIAIATLDPDTLAIVEEYDTLVNPLRDISADVSDIHGLTASHLEAAPTFQDIAPAIATRLNGAVLVAHNARFDLRMLDQEFRRAPFPFDGGHSFCTCNAMGRLALTDACARFDISIQDHHRALSDVRATAALYKALAHRKGDSVFKHCRVAQCPVPEQDVVVRTLRRESIGGSPIRRVTRSPWREPRLAYRYTVNAALDDNHIDAAEWGTLDALAETLGLTQSERDAQHLILYQRALDAANRDGHISQQESDYLHTLAETLLLTDVIVPEESHPVCTIDWGQGLRVCFTGSGGAMLARDEMDMIAERIGHIPVSGVTRKLDLLVTANQASHSGKIVKARTYDIPILEAGHYLTHAYTALDRPFEEAERHMR